MIVVDFETEAIQDRPNYPPKPVGVAIMEEGKKPEYLAWGHPTNNNSTIKQAVRYLKGLWKQTLLFHNAKFDLEVARVHLGLDLPTWDRVHDTLYLLFLADPHAPSLSLKPASERLLGMAPEEQDAVAQWLVANRVIGKNQRPGAFLCKAPGDIVGRYAIGDVVRTRRLFDKLYPLLDARERQAYDRERKLMPILLDNEQDGIRIDVARLARDVKTYVKAMEVADDWIRKVLRSPGLNLDADADVAKALREAKIVTEFAKTPTGRDSVSKKNLTIDKFHDPRVALVLGYRNRLQTVLSMSMIPWLDQASGDGRIYTEWNQVRQSHGNDNKGTRSGRLSCSRFMNITKDFADKGDGYVHPDHIVLPTLPLVRRYLLPEKKQQWIHLDYNQQEFRILAHFENDGLMRSYRENPRIDYHDNMQKLIKDIAGLDLPRRSVKILNFGILYGMGLGRLAESLRCSVDTARALRDAQREAAPGVAELDKELKRMGRKGEPIRTWGGRRYFCEAPKVIGGHERTFEYKLLNYLIQGSAADCTKEAIIRYHDVRKEGRMLVTVHDEINISAPPKSGERAVLREVMESIEFDVPMLTDGKTGSSWGELTK